MNATEEFVIFVFFGLNSNEILCETIDNEYFDSTNEYNSEHSADYEKDVASKTIFW